MEFWVFLAVLVAFCAGFAACYAFFALVERRALSLVRTEASKKGNLKQQEYSDERAAALAEAVAIYQGEGTNEEKLKKGAALLVKYPSSAAWLVKQFRAFQKNGFEGLIGEAA